MPPWSVPAGRRLRRSGGTASSLVSSVVAASVGATTSVRDSGTATLPEPAAPGVYTTSSPVSGWWKEHGAYNRSLWNSAPGSGGPAAVRSPRTSFLMSAPRDRWPAESTPRVRRPVSAPPFACTADSRPRRPAECGPPPRSSPREATDTLSSVQRLIAFVVQRFRDHTVQQYVSDREVREADL